MDRFSGELESPAVPSRTGNNPEPNPTARIASPRHHSCLRPAMLKYYPYRGGAPLSL